MKSLLNIKDKIKKNKILHAIYKVVKSRNNERELHHIISGYQSWITRDINLDVTRTQKRILICYLDNYNMAELLRFQAHTNIEELYVIIKYFIERNFVIDICDNRNSDSLEEFNNQRYDVIFGFGKAYQKATKTWKEALHIEYFTENPYWYSLKKEEARVANYNKRNNKHKKLYRTGMFYGEDDEYNANVIIHMGEADFFKAVDAPLYQIVPHGLVNEKYSQLLFKKEQNKFLVFGTNGYIHKGIDILIEVFKELPHLQLFICGGLKEYIKDNGEIAAPNIIDCGKVRVDSDEYLRLVNECMFVILPSCSEVFPTGVITCMRHGVIPIITKGFGMDKLIDCFFIEETTKEVITNAILKASRSEYENLRERSNSVYKIANNDFTIEAFRNRIFSIFDKILEKDYE